MATPMCQILLGPGTQYGLCRSLALQGRDTLIQLISRIILIIRDHWTNNNCDLRKPVTILSPQSGIITFTDEIKLFNLTLKLLRTSPTMPKPTLLLYKIIHETP